MKQFWKTKKSLASSFYVWKIPLFLLIPALVVLALAISLPLILLKKKAPRLETLCKPEATENHWRYIVLHHSATHEGSAARFDTFHREVRGWENGLGYHFVIGNGTDSRDGEIEVGKRWKKQLSGAHAGDSRYNRMGIGICLVGNFEEGDRPTRRQMKSLINIIRYLSQRYDIPRSSIILHKDVHDTACPGKNFPYKKVMKSLRYLASSECSKCGFRIVECGIKTTPHSAFPIPHSERTPHFTFLLRRARGYAPYPLRLASPFGNY
ncbi:MAG TPA: N-acetylmuramoyl-L-alanine amidase, partial [Candidatus Tripitaka sp. YC43]